MYRCTFMSGVRLCDRAITEKRVSVQSVHPRRCKTSSVGQSAGLSVLRSSVRFRQKLKKNENPNLHAFEVHTPSSKGTKITISSNKRSSVGYKTTYSNAGDDSVSNQKRPISINRDVYESKETYTYQKRPAMWSIQRFPQMQNMICCKALRRSCDQT